MLCYMLRHGFSGLKLYVLEGPPVVAHDVFISYSQEDKVTADAVCATLEANKTRCWVAPRDVLPGSAWGEAIIDAINECSVMVLVFSSWANKSQQVAREVERAANRTIPIIPFRIEDVEPSKSMEYFISTPHWLDAMTPPIEQHLVRLTTTVAAQLQRSRSAEEAAAVSGSTAPAPSSVRPAVSKTPRVFLGWRPRNTLDRLLLYAAGGSGALAALAFLLYMAGV